VSAGVDSLKAALEALQERVRDAVDDVDTAITDCDNEQDELRQALDSARSEMRDALAAMQACSAAVRELCSGEVIDELSVCDALDELDHAATSLDCAADEVTGALGDQEQQTTGAAP
jgi:predicted  nucleic acid-binding Zn-ribbon protein